MNMSLDQAKKIKKDFMREYFIPPYTDYINGCGISSLKMMKNHFGESEESREDMLCLFVTLKKDLPQEVNFPSEYKGLKVFYETVGTVAAV
jgi:hypothetical protein